MTDNKDFTFPTIEEMDRKHHKDVKAVDDAFNKIIAGKHGSNK